jgi:hypothetical protein
LLVWIPVNSWKQVIYKLSLPLLSPRTVNILTHTFDTSFVLPQLLLAKDRQKTGLFQACTIFLPFFVPQISLSIFWLERSFPIICQKLFDTSLSKIPLNFILQLPHGNLTFVPIYCCAVVLTLSKLHEQKFPWFRKKCESSSDKLHVAVNNSTDTWLSHSKWISAFISLGSVLPNCTSKTLKRYSKWF